MEGRIAMAFSVEKQARLRELAPPPAPRPESQKAALAEAY